MYLKGDELSEWTINEFGIESYFLTGVFILLAFGGINTLRLIFKKEDKDVKKSRN